jgi:flagellar motor switch protein FliG
MINLKLFKEDLLASQKNLLKEWSNREEINLIELYLDLTKYPETHVPSILRYVDKKLFKQFLARMDISDKSLLKKIKKCQKIMPKKKSAKGKKA